MMMNTLIGDSSNIVLLMVLGCRRLLLEHHKTINERARSMRLHSGLPKTFWVDAVNTVVYLINRDPSVPLEYRLDQP